MNSVEAPRHLRILHLEDSKADHALVSYALRTSGLDFEILRIETLAELDSQLVQTHFDVILADYHLAGFTGMDAWALVQARTQTPPFIILSGAIGEEAAVDAMRNGISDYVMKDNMGKLPWVIQRAIENRDILAAKNRADEELRHSRQQLADLADHLQSSIEQERAAIAREIHDDIGGTLTAMKFDLAWIARHTQDAEVLQRAQAVSEMVQHALTASQRIMHNLRPAILDQGLVAALQWLTSSFEKRTGIKTSLLLSADTLHLERRHELVAYRTVQEALTNATKHAACTLVRVEVSHSHDMLTVEISDNGQGFSPEARLKPKAFGLRGLQERARTMEGWLDISSRVGQGTAVMLSLPTPSTPAPNPTTL